MTTLTVSVAELWVQGRRYDQGQEFEAPEREAKILVGVGKAAYKQPDTAPPAQQTAPAQAAEVQASSADTVAQGTASDTGTEDATTTRRRRRAMEPAFKPEETATDPGTAQTQDTSGTLRTTAATAEGEDDRWQDGASGGSTASAEGRYSRRDMRSKT